MMETGNLRKVYPPPPEQEKEKPTKSTEEEFGINLETEDHRAKKESEPEKSGSD